MIKLNQRGFSVLQILIIIGLVVIVVIGGSFLIKKASNKNEIDPNDYVKESQAEPPIEDTTAKSRNVEIANPASSNCVNKGGQVVIKTLPNGGQYGVCNFTDNKSCEEWALYRGECPVGGVKTIGFDSPAQIYCVISGGKTTAVKNAICKFDDGSSCSTETYYNGSCLRGEKR